MREFFTQDEIVVFAKALSSELRVSILQYLAEHPGTGLMDLATCFGVSRAAITQNIKALTDAGLVEFGQSTGKGSARKACYLKEQCFLLNLGRPFDRQKIYSTEMPIGQYINHEIMPTCGIATTETLIGRVDDPAFFDDPQRVNAGILWFGSGYVEYRLPNYLQKGQSIEEMQFSLELSSEAPGVAEHWPSDLLFSFNGHDLGYWTSPGDYGEVRGRFTPAWWTRNWNQYGLLKLLVINKAGTYIDGLMISPVRITDLNLDEKSEFRFRIASPADARNAGGCTIFGRGFGNYNQGIKFNVIYTEAEIAKESPANEI
ncbi:ArsR/SmtB family transcription factor [Mitsuokella jalaludinii]|uniref:ArsR/SmtB family transcription factor n=1 Tax=Mitsuokella jalaludinii TaxID=187979 RepID=UPI0022E0AF8E|nr:helix-turn-helix domain-containing protein [Mitsuokella jalaludinii]